MTKQKQKIGYELYEDDRTQQIYHAKNEENAVAVEDLENKEKNNEPKEAELDLKDSKIIEIEGNHDQELIQHRMKSNFNGNHIPSQPIKKKVTNFVFEFYYRIKMINVRLNVKLLRLFS